MRCGRCKDTGMMSEIRQTPCTGMNGVCPYLLFKTQEYQKANKKMENLTLEELMVIRQLVPVIKSFGAPFFMKILRLLKWAYKNDIVLTNADMIDSENKAAHLVMTSNAEEFLNATTDPTFIDGLKRMGEQAKKQKQEQEATDFMEKVTEETTEVCSDSWPPPTKPAGNEPAGKKKKGSELNLNFLTEDEMKGKKDT